MYRIGLFSKINKVTVKTLRYYDEAGLLKPAYVDPINGYRYYTTEQLPIIHKIIALRQIGFSIDEIRLVLEGSNAQTIFEEKEKQIKSVIEESKHQLSLIKHYLGNLKEDFSMDYNVVLKELPEVLVYSKRMVVENYDEYFQLIPSIGEEVTKVNPDLQCQEPAYCFIIYHDGEYKESDIDVEYCEAVTKIGQDTETIKFKTMDKVKDAACVLHKGPYSTIGNAYAYLFKWISDNGYEVIDNPRESYIDGIWNKEDPNEWLTELQIPVKKK